MNKIIFYKLNNKLSNVRVILIFYSEYIFNADRASIFTKMGRLSILIVLKLMLMSKEN